MKFLTTFQTADFFDTPEILIRLLFDPIGLCFDEEAAAQWIDRIRDA